MAQKVGSVGRENVLFLDKNFMSPVIDLGGEMMQNLEAWHHTHAHTERRLADNTLYWVWASMVRCFSLIFIVFRIKIYM